MNASCVVADPLVEVLHALRRRFAAEGTWTQGATARDIAGNITGAFRPRATSWSIDAAIWLACQDAARILEERVTRLLAAHLNVDPTEVTVWNDHPDRTLQDVRDAIAEVLATLLDTEVPER